MLESVKWSINNVCNLNCPYCFADNSFTTNSFDEKCKILDKLNQMKIKYIDFFGKEPLFNDEIFKLITYSNSKNYDFYFSFISNGKNLKKYTNEIINSGIKEFTISYDCGLKGRSFNIDLNDLKIFFDNGIFIEVTLDVHSKNLDEILSNIYDFENYGVQSIYLNPIVPMGKRSADTQEFSITETEYEKFLTKIDFKKLPYVTCKIPFEFSRLTSFYKKHNNFEKVFYYTEPKCTAGINHFFIASDGFAYGCVSSAYIKNPQNCHFLTTPTKDLIKILKNKCGRGCMCYE